MEEAAHWEEAIEADCVAELNAQMECAATEPECDLAEACRDLSTAYVDCYQDYLYGDVGDVLNDPRFDPTTDDVCGDPGNYCEEDRAECEASLEALRRSAVAFDCIEETNALYSCVVGGIDCEDSAGNCPEERRVLADCILGVGQ